MKRNKLPYKGTLVRKMPKEICTTCKHFGCTDSIETTCIGYEKVSKLREWFRKLIGNF